MKNLLLACTVFFSVCASWAPVWAQSYAPARQAGPWRKLESSVETKCLDQTSANSLHTPVALSSAMIDCVRQSRLDDAVFLYAMSGVYGNFDSLRVSDPSAPQAVSVLRMAVMDSLTDQQKAVFKQRVVERLQNQDYRARVCNQIDRIGPPQYFPNYMIQHGMAAIVGPRSDNGLKPRFDEKVAWKGALNSYLHCQSS